MAKVSDITVLTVDEKTYAVDSMNDEIKAFVEVYNDWNRKEADVRDELFRFQAAKQTLSQQIVGKVREHLAEVTAAEAAKASPPVAEGDATAPHSPTAD